MDNVHFYAKDFDASSFLYRAYHALPDLRSKKGHPTGALHGIINMLKKVRLDWPSQIGACVFDPKGPTFRDEIFSDYSNPTVFLTDKRSLNDHEQCNGIGNVTTDSNHKNSIVQHMNDYYVSIIMLTTDYTLLEILLAIMACAAQNGPTSFRPNVSVTLIALFCGD